ncbi:hypothetical protein CMI37_28135, partial [Candidatus Pacearchaeota archaeon]|nr:hypothetical protein [Candidatus Pacearchaeota archaeon]
YKESWTAKALEMVGEQGIIIEENAQDTSAGAWVCKASDEGPDKSVTCGQGDAIALVVTTDNIEDGGTIKFDLLTSTSVAGAGPKGEKGSAGEKGPKGDSGSVNVNDPATVVAIDRIAKKWWILS